MRFLYGLERAAMLFGTEKIGEHFWYAEGAKALLEAQAEDGSWGKDTPDWFNRTWDTCFSILFLRRATRPLVATESAGKLKKRRRANRGFDVPSRADAAIAVAERPP
jgi:hypothetical protein